MTEVFVDESKHNVSWVELGWDFTSLFFLATGAFCLIYGDWLNNIPELIIPGFVGLIMACYTKLCLISRKLP